MKITKRYRNNDNVIYDNDSNNENAYASNGNVVINSGWRGNGRSVFEISIPAIMLRKLRDACNQALKDIDGFERHTTVTLADRSFKEGGA